MRTGILGGTFDPVHNGHIQIALEARKVLGLDEVLMMPAGQPLLKPERAITPAEHRLAMLELAIRGIEGLAVSALELERQGPSYTVDTIEELRNKAGAQDELYFILGWDNLDKLKYWKDPGRILELCKIAAVPRPGCEKPSVNIMDRELPGLGKNTVMMDGPLVDISASSVRDRVAAGKNIDDMVPVPVARYIKEQGLYQEAPAAITKNADGD